MPFATITVHTGATGGPSVTLSGAEFPTIGTATTVTAQYPVPTRSWPMW